VMLGVVALAALARLLGHLLPGRERALERAVVCAAFAVHPLFTSSTLQPNVDFGTLVFALPCICALMERKVIAATALGCLLVFTKEPALIVYAVFVLATLFFLVPRPAGTWRAALAHYRPYTPLAVPLVVAGVYLAPAMVVTIPRLLSSGESPHGLAAGLVTARMLIDAVDLNYFLGLFALNFMWIPAMVIVADVGMSTIALRQGRAEPPSPGPLGQTKAIAYATFATAVLLTRYKTFSNFRYVLVLYPLLILVFAVALTRRVAWRPARLGVLAVLVAVFAVSNFRTIDPVSRTTFGTWPFGTHDLIDVTMEYGRMLRPRPGSARVQHGVHRHRRARRSSAGDDSTDGRDRTGDGREGELVHAGPDRSDHVPPYARSGRCDRSAPDPDTLSRHPAAVARPLRLPGFRVRGQRAVAQIARRQP